MKSLVATRAMIGVAIAALGSGAAIAQMTPGVEIIGQPLQVTTNGTTDTLYLDPGGSLRIVTPGGNTVPGTWTAANGQLCIGTGGPQECVPYAAPFQAGQPLTLTSSCGASETWLAQATNAPPPPPPAQGERGERGR
jgi:hypothetical protein